eukprot:2823750-Lingulodinium_polyedra.AAC.1
MRCVASARAVANGGDCSISGPPACTGAASAAATPPAGQPPPPCRHLGRGGQSDQLLARSPPG